MTTIFTTCEHCASRFEAPIRSAGGLTNCPDCGKATEVPGGTDALWTWTVGLFLVGSAIAVFVAFAAGGVEAATLVLVVCVAVGLVARLSA